MTKLKQLQSLIDELKKGASSNIRIAKYGSPVTSMEEEVGLGMVGKEQKKIAKKIERILNVRELKRPESGLQNH